MAAVIRRAGCLVLDFDGVVCRVWHATPSPAVDWALVEFLDRVPRPRPLITLTFSRYRTLRYLLEHEPDRAVEAEALLTSIEFDTASVVPPTAGLDRLLDACELTSRAVAVVSDVSEHVVSRYLQAHRLSDRVAAVVARAGLDLESADVRVSLPSVCNRLDVTSGECVFVSGTRGRLSLARDVSVPGIGCEVGHDRRKHLAEPGTPVVSNLSKLADAITALAV